MDVKVASTLPANERLGSFVPRWAEGAGIVLLVGLTTYQLLISWRKWNHPIIDFGRELYTPWRLSEGAVLYRDVESVYGPLSQYLNAGLFKCFGPGLMVLVAANLVVVGLIISLVYFSFRAGWGVVGALAASVVFVSVFAFSQYLSVGNFNYATPYSHETTHGMLVALALLTVLVRWIRKPTVRRNGVVGVLLGLTFILKPEFILAGILLLLVATLLTRKASGRWPWRAFLVVCCWAIVPTAAFAVYFASQMGLARGVMVASYAWLGVLLNPITTKTHQAIALGFDHLGSNLLAHAIAALVAMSSIGALLFGLRISSRFPQPYLRLAARVILAAGAIFAATRIEWIHIGRCLLGLSVIYWALLFRATWSDREQREPPRWCLLAVTLAIALLGRMLLNGRIYQFGYFQAALAAMVIVAGLTTGRLGLRKIDAPGEALTRALVFAGLFLPGIFALMVHSHNWLKRETYSIGSDRDMFYTFPPTVDVTGETLSRVVDLLRHAPASSTLLALPEGGMINYLARMKNPLPQFQYYSFTTENGLESNVVHALEQTPPDWVAIINRDLRDFGIQNYGIDGNGREIILWINRNYEMVLHVGGNPLNPNEGGAYVLRRKSR